MEENIKKPRRFLKMLGKVGEIIAQEALLKILRGVVNRIGGKKNLPSILFLFLSVSLFAQYPATGNKQRLGYQTTGDGLVWRGRASDTVSLKSSTINNAYIIIDTLTNVMYNYIKTKGGWLFNNADTVIINNNFSQPVDSLFFKTSVPTNNVDTAKMRWDSDLGTVVLGMYDKVPNELGFKNFWLVKNQTGSTITKGSLVYASGTVGSSGRISVSKFIANGTIDPIYLLGITAHDLTDGEDGYVISYGKIRQVNTDTFAAGAILYPSPTTAGVWTDVEPVAPNIDLPIGFCINSSLNNGTIAIRYASGYKLSELHDLAISSPVDKASLYYRDGLWRDTTQALLTSDTASMVLPYFRDTDTTLLNLSSRFAAKQNILNGTGFVKAFGTTISYDNSTYLTTSSASSTYLPLTGGTVTGNVTLTKGDGNQLFINGSDNDRRSEITFGTAGNQRWRIYSTTSTSYINFESIPQASALRGFRFLGSYDDVSTLGICQDIKGNVGIKSNVDGGGEHSHTLYVNGTFATTGNSSIGGTLGVTSTTTLSGALTVNNATVLNEGSGDYDTRIESDGNANMVFVDASTNRVGIGTATPSKTLDVVGTLGVSGVATFAGNTVIDGGLKAKILKESGTGGFFNQIPSDVVTYIFEYTGATTGGGSTDFLGSPSSHTNRIINIINVSDVDYYLGFMTNLPYIKTNTTISELDYGQSMTVQSDGSKWWVISRNF